jgi:hypothetical protein
VYWEFEPLPKRKVVPSECFYTLVKLGKFWIVGGTTFVFSKLDVVSNNWKRIFNHGNWAGPFDQCRPPGFSWPRPTGQMASAQGRGTQSPILARHCVAVPPTDANRAALFPTEVPPPHAHAVLSTNAHGLSSKPSPFSPPCSSLGTAFTSAHAPPLRRRAQCCPASSTDANVPMCPRDAFDSSTMLSHCPP